MRSSLPEGLDLGVLPGMAQAVRALDCPLPLGAVTRLSAGGGALPVIMSIIGPRETHDYRNYNLLGSGTIKSKKKKKKVSCGRPGTDGPAQTAKARSAKTRDAIGLRCPAATARSYGAAFPAWRFQTPRGPA